MCIKMFDLVIYKHNVRFLYYIHRYITTLSRVISQHESRILYKLDFMGWHKRFHSALNIDIQPTTRLGIHLLRDMVLT